MSQQIGSSSHSNIELHGEISLEKDKTQERQDFVDAFMAQCRARVELELASLTNKGMDHQAGVSFFFKCDIRQEQSIDVKMGEQA